MQKGALWCRDQIVVPDALRTQHLGERLVGLLGRPSLPGGCGLLISPCNAVHTLGMRFVIDIVFIDSTWRVLRTFAAVPPGRFSVWGGWGARHTLEVQAGWIDLESLAGACVRWDRLDE
jgi:uncharacterized membrane protein (UPF0127 family)